jgi:hypothetical protein
MGDARIVSAVNVVYKRFKHALAVAFLDAVAERDEIDGDVVLLQFLRKLDHRLLVAVLTLARRRPDEHDDPLAQVLVLAVFQGELRDGERGGDVDLAANFGGRGVHAAEYLAQVFGVRYQHFRAVDSSAQTGRL